MYCIEVDPYCGHSFRGFHWEGVHFLYPIEGYISLIGLLKSEISRAVLAMGLWFQERNPSQGCYQN